MRTAASGEWGLSFISSALAHIKLQSSTATCTPLTDGHQDLPGDRHKAGAMTITESVPIRWPPPRGISPDASYAARRGLAW